MTAPEVRLGRSHRTALLPAVSGSAGSGWARRADPAAWPPTMEAAAARARWAERHPAVQVVQEVRSSGPVTGAELADALDAAGDRAAAAGVRRLDLRLDAGSPAAAHLAAAGWILGRLPHGSGPGELIASRALAHPWARPPRPLPTWAAPLPVPVQRTLRRLRDLRPAELPGIARTLADEVRGAIHDRRRPPAAESVARAGAPAGAHPFAATRYATLDEALARVAPGLRDGLLVDIGAGDGRVLRRALDLGMAAVLGRELDPDLAARARALAPEATLEVGDALADALPDRTSVVFLNNPFAAEVVPRLAALVADTLATRPRPLVVLYVNPPTIAPLLAAGLVVVDVTPRLTVFASEAP